MSATPIPRTLILTFYGDMDVSRLIEKPKNNPSDDSVFISESAHCKDPTIPCAY